MTKRVLSGSRPTGCIHLGNYLGAIKNWVSLQNTEDFTKTNLLYCIVDMHALSEFTSPSELKESIYTLAAAYMACGIDPEKAHIFVQSSVRGHTDLAWILGCLTPLGWLNRMTQYKDKTDHNKEAQKLGLYAYPVLMAADVLLYHVTHVPVGEDQKQHLELARDLATVFNNIYRVEHFCLPEPVILKEGCRVMSLRDGRSKMSKSDPSDFSRIHLMDREDDIVSKIKKAKTDAGDIPADPYELKNRPDVENLLEIWAVLQGKTLKDACQHFSGKGFATLKKELADVLVHAIRPIGQEMESLLSNRDFLDKVLKEGADHASHIAHDNLKAIYDIVGFHPII